MELLPKHITLNGQPVSVSDLLQKEGKTEWEKEWLDFLKEWYSKSDHINVQTSGSTGTPKVIQLKKDFVAASAKRTIQFFNLQENDRVLHCLPSRFIAGKLMIVRALIGKLDLQIIDPATNFEFLKTKNFKFAAMVPNQISKILEYESWNLEFLLIGGAAIPHQIERQLQQFSTICYSSYAMTETATHIALRKLNGRNPQEFYHCLEDIHVELSNDECLQIFMPGLEIPYLQTTDLAELKDEKTFHILGRADNVIISGGIKYSPEAIEKKLESFISQPFMISSLPHETLGSQIILQLEESENEETRQEIKAICEQHLDKFEQPRQIHFINELPRTGNGKLKRK